MQWSESDLRLQRLEVDDPHENTARSIATKTVAILPSEHYILPIYCYTVYSSFHARGKHLLANGILSTKLYFTALFSAVS